MVEVDPMIIAVVAGLVTLALVLVVGKNIFFPKTSLTKTVPSSNRSARDDVVTKSKKKKPSPKKKIVKPVEVVPESKLADAVSEPEPEEEEDDDDDDDMLPAPTKKASAKQQKNAPVEKKVKKPEPVIPKVEVKEVKKVEVAQKPKEVIPEEFILEDVLNQSNDLNESYDDVWAVVTKAKAKKPNGSSSLEDELPQAATPTGEPHAVSVVAPSVPSEPIDKATDEVVIPAKKVGAIIGQKGATKFSLQAATQTEITLPKVLKESTEPVTAIITGPLEGVKKAKKAIQDLITKGFTAILEAEDFRETQVPVHQMYVTYFASI
jgi:KH domain